MAHYALLLVQYQLCITLLCRRRTSTSPRASLKKYKSVDSEDGHPAAAGSPAKSESGRRLVTTSLPSNFVHILKLPLDSKYLAHLSETSAVANRQRPTAEHFTALHNHKHPKVRLLWSSDAIFTSIYNIVFRTQRHSSYQKSIDFCNAPMTYTSIGDK